MARDEPIEGPPLHRAKQVCSPIAEPAPCRRVRFDRVPPAPNALPYTTSRQGVLLSRVDQNLEALLADHELQPGVNGRERRLVRCVMNASPSIFPAAMRRNPLDTCSGRESEAPTTRSSP